MSSQPPYLRAAAGIRRRIESGELAPGDRVPSTRAIVRECGVAMATATKALAVLRQEGLVRAVPGVGTVVAGHPAPGLAGPSGRGLAGPSGPVTAADSTPGPAALASPGGQGPARDRIVRTAVAFADADGLATLSMRRVATGLGVSTMALYRHVRGKGELVQLMADAVYGEQPLPAAQPAHWRARFELGTRWLWDAHRRHSWMARAMASFTRPTPSPNAMAYTEWMLRAGADTGLSPHQVMHLHLTLFGHVQGLATATDLEGQAVQDTGLSNDEWMARNETQFAALGAGGAYPHLNSLAGHPGFELDLGQVFEFGLARILDGVAALVSKHSV
ncbi:TetR/AcrR family transcriptional regulator C-terminal domain-containing protein [Streptomyces sp. NPDC059398]|uniref:TetR/AcrR family transcriptional regulator C-terminal domain-containing protein n=1 Tax=Streptomyces sp. NPDC059398 TaxID=3346820 RepID=UPI0036CDAA50